MVPTFFFIFLLHTSFLFFSAQSFCYNNGNYTVNSTYAANLNAVLSSIPGNIDVASGFYNASAGRAPDRAYATALCRGDAQPEICRGCIRNLTTDLLSACPYQRQAIEWAEFCILRYSNESLIGTPPQSRPAVFMWNTQNATNPARFMEDLRALLDGLRDRAAGGGPRRKVAAANVTATDFQTIFAMVQCTPDLTADDCSSCLINAAQDIPGCCDRRRGGRVWWPSCTIRYETEPFYNLTRLQELEPAPPSPAPLSPPPSVVVPQQPPPPGTSGGNNSTTRTVIIVVVSVAASLILAIFAIVLFRKRTKRKPDEQHQTDDLSNSIESLKYSLTTLREATNDFADVNKLGQGGFGTVYKGVLSNGQEIAVKRLAENSGQGDVEFKNEVLLLAKLQHRNLVRLLGYCLEGTEKLLVYEFVQNSSLDQFIFDPVKRSYLDWEKRYKIIGGIARGILYLHEDSQLRIIHRDLKPNNVLLDGSMNPKIADFGMARLFRQDETHGNTSRIAGTFGYMAPEYVMHGQFSVKTDVFSFGVLVLEIISGEKNNCVRRGGNIEALLSFAWKNWKDSTAANFVDPCLRSGSGSISEILRCIHIGLLCVQENPADRPTMASIVLMINSFSLTLAAPSEPAFYMPSDYGSDSQLLQEHRLRESDYRNHSSKSSVPSEDKPSSRNDASITDLYPR
ncbi:Cysteine-rich receptor-like protein kinase 29 [Striga hermonthica]|uniref:Cysteine-rich receptor-like protein kinase 29 n=1 Tax=Striga hermonthica TaxID=68872 RepID=A0A9N7NNT7_STRHE|nr:Cysteine-rich receptor-like protein kinase 29 [Striga hermonthica]